jgi:cytochrome c oxidase assembly protein subunit 15
MTPLRHDGTIAPALGARWSAHPGQDRFAIAFARPVPLRGLLVVTTLIAFLAFVLGVGNRFTTSPLFIYIPEVDLVPPLDRAAWQQAFALHQQSPLYALCGGYQVSGMESLTVYQLLYMWEWLRAGSVLMLAACGGLLGVFALRDLTGGVVSAVSGDTRRAVLHLTSAEMRYLVGLAGLAAAYLPLRYFADHAGLFATINIGQHRHALDVTFASLAMAFLLCAAIDPGAKADRGRSRRLWAAVWAVLVALDIAFGALLEATDGAVVWSTFPGYADGVLPSLDRLFAFHPAWRNITENVYLIQASHRVLSVGLWLAALMALAATAWRRQRLAWPALLFGLLTLDGALGVATLAKALPAVLSITHQFAAVLVLVAVLAPVMTSLRRMG